MNLRPYLAVTGISFRNTLTYRSNLFFYTIGTVLQLLLMLAVWGALEAQGALGGQLSFRRMATYSALGFSLNISFSVFYIYGYLTDLIRKGDLALELVRPLEFLPNLLFRYFGFSIFRTFFLALPFSVACWWILGLEVPVGLSQDLGFLLSVVLAYLLNYFIFFLFALLTFISLDNSGILMTFMSLSSLFSGLYLPFWIFPDWLRTVAEVLPFKGIYFVPISVFLGTMDPFQGIAFQGVWAVVLGGLGLLLWRVMVRRIVVQGG